MTVLIAENLSKSYGADLVFSGVSVTVGRADRVGVVGPNGAGKTTLLEIIAGRLEPTAGRARLVGRPRLGYLEQEVKPAEGDGPPLYEHAHAALALLSRHEARLHEIEREMVGLRPSSPRLAELVEEYGVLREAFERDGGYAKEARTREVLFGVGFGPEHLALPLGRLSGGQRTRAHLARLLLEGPDLLLLDEPTIHLDLEAVEWLEEFLKTFPGSVIAVSHDRYFLDNVVRRVLEIEHQRATLWTGNYTAYAAQKEARLAQARKAYSRQREEIDRLEAYVRRYIAGNRTTMAQSRQRTLARMKRLAKPPGSPRRVGLRFVAAATSGREVLHLREVGLAFADAPGWWLFRGVNAAVRRGQRIALVGRNGAGKTTLLEVLVGRRQPSAGQVAWGAGVKVGYFSQGLDDLHDSRTVLDETMEATGFDLPTARSYLGRFLFSGDEVSKPVSSLSGGERNRLVLACLVAARPNVLVLDEPTNHLDLPAREALEKALAEFAGTVLFASHDRYFIDSLATRVWELDSGSLIDFAGSYKEYKLWRTQERAKKAGPANAETLTASAATAGGKTAPPLSKGRRARLVHELEAAQGEVDRLERRRRELETLLADPASYHRGAGANLATEYRELLVALEKAMARWEELALAAEASRHLSSGHGPAGAARP